MKLSTVLAKFPINNSFRQVEVNSVHHDSAPASTMQGPILLTAWLTRENAVDVRQGLNSEGKPKQTQSDSTPFWTPTYTKYFEHTFSGEPDWEADGSECSETLVDDLEVIVGPSRHAAKPYDLRQLKIYSVRTQSWEPIRSTPSTLYFTDVISLSQALVPTRSLSFGSVLHMNGLVQCRPCTFDRPKQQCKKNGCVTLAICTFVLSTWSCRPETQLSDTPANQHVDSNEHPRGDKWKSVCFLGISVWHSCKNSGLLINFCTCSGQFDAISCIRSGDTPFFSDHLFFNLWLDLHAFVQRSIRWAFKEWQVEVNLLFAFKCLAFLCVL